MRESECTYGHHGAGRFTSDKDLLSITIVLLKNELGHVGNRGTAATTLVLQCHLGRDIPAVTRCIRSLRVNNDEPVLLSIGSPLCALVVSLSGASAVVKSNDDSRVGLQVLRHVQEHLCAGWVVAIAGDLLELTSRNDLCAEDGAEEG